MGETNPAGEGSTVLNLQDESWATLRDLGEIERDRDVVFEHYPAIGRIGEYMLSHTPGSARYDFFVVDVTQEGRSTGQSFHAFIEADSACVYTLVIPDAETLAATQTDAKGEDLPPEQLIQQVGADVIAQIGMGLSFPSEADIETFRDAVTSWSVYSGNRRE